MKKYIACLVLVCSMWTYGLNQGHTADLDTQINQATSANITFDPDSLVATLLDLEDFSAQQIQVLMDKYGEDSLLLFILDALAPKIEKLKVKADKLLEAQNGKQ